MESKKPLKRIESLKPLSHDHHQALLLCWKIRTGFKKSVEIARIKQYVDWFFENHLIPHFIIEEKYVFPVLGNNHKLIKKALSEHRRLIRLYKSKTEVLKKVSLIEEELEKHVRFEERVVFNEIQLIANPQQLKEIEEHHSHATFTENLVDPFWK